LYKRWRKFYHGKGCDYNGSKNRRTKKSPSTDTAEEGRLSKMISGYNISQDNLDINIFLKKVREIKTYGMHTQRKGALQVVIKLLLLQTAPFLWRIEYKTINLSTKK
jgi:hypothetical protein